MLIRGDDLSAQQRKLVLDAYTYRSSMPESDARFVERKLLCKTRDEVWLSEKAFHFLKDGSRLSYTHRYCVQL